MTSTQLIDLNGIADRLSIEDTVISLFTRTDGRDWPGVRQTFAPRVWFDMSSLSGAAPAETTPETIAAAWEEGLRAIPYVHHQIANLRTEIQGDEAGVRAYGIAYHHRPQAAAAGSTRKFVGSYELRLRRDGAAWRIHAFRYDSGFVEGNLGLGQN